MKKNTRPFAELRVRMVRSNLTQRELAQAAGMAESTLSERMRCNSPFHADEIDRIAKVLKISKEDYYMVFFDKSNYALPCRSTKSA